jgi:hypothetical protein
MMYFFNRMNKGIEGFYSMNQLQFVRDMARHNNRIFKNLVTSQTPIFEGPDRANVNQWIQAEILNPQVRKVRRNLEELRANLQEVE